MVNIVTAYVEEIRFTCLVAQCHQKEIASELVEVHERNQDEYHNQDRPPSRVSGLEL